MAITRQNTGAALLGKAIEEEAGMGRMKITHATLVHGQHAAVGDIVEVDRKTARCLIANGKAVPYAGAPEPPVTREEPTEKPAPKAKRRRKPKATPKE